MVNLLLRALNVCENWPRWRGCGSRFGKSGADLVKQKVKKEFAFSVEFEAETPWW